jgi:phosphatidylinositol alpha-mannosyltransferase
VRIAVVSPYSWTYPGGVTRHIEALAGELRGLGHDVAVLAPYDPDDRLSRRLHGGARPQVVPPPEGFVSLGRGIGLKFNGAVSNVALGSRALLTVRRELRQGDYDVVHIHEPVVPLASWDALCVSDLPLVGTFHTYSESRLTNGGAVLLGARRRMNRLHVRIAVSEAAAWTARRFFGGRYRIVPNGVELDRLTQPLQPELFADEERPLRVVFVGQAVDRKGLPVLLRAFEALREQVPATLTLVGAGAEEVEHMMLDDRGVRALGKVSDEVKRAELRAADVLCAPSLHGESFGMVLTEAFAAGTPVVASDIPGYRDVARHGDDSLLVQRGNALALAEALRELALDPGRRADMAARARARAERFAWPHVAAEVLEAYEDAIATPAADTSLHRAAVRGGFAPADLRPPLPARHLPSLEPPVEVAPARRAARIARRVALVASSVGGLALSALALSRIGLDHVAASLVASRPSWVLLGFAFMCAAMVARGFAWHAILRAAPGAAHARRIDAMQGTFIGVLMSATLPARLGEPSRALIVARRLGRARETLPVVLGTIVSQTLLNLVALAILGAIMFSSANLFNGHHQALLAIAVAPAAALVAIMLAPAIVPAAAVSRFARVAALVARVREALVKVRGGLRVFRRPRLAAQAAGGQLLAWGLQLVSCYFLLMALGLDHRAGVAGAAAVLFAVNVTAVIPATPSNLGVFQAACVAVLSGAFHVSVPDALAFGIILQVVEVLTAVLMGMPALLKEGMSWKDVRLRAMHAAPVKLPPLPAGRGARAGRSSAKGTAAARR